MHCHVHEIHAHVSEHLHTQSHALIYVYMHARTWNTLIRNFIDAWISRYILHQLHHTFITWALWFIAIITHAYIHELRFTLACIHMNIRLTESYIDTRTHRANHITSHKIRSHLHCVGCTHHTRCAYAQTHEFVFFHVHVCADHITSQLHNLHTLINYVLPTCTYCIHACIRTYMTWHEITLHTYTVYTQDMHARLYLHVRTHAYRGRDANAYMEACTFYIQII